jgi:Zn-dependent protease/CBS domain-containing protein
MKWSWRILTVAGIGIYVHATFVLLPLFFAVLTYQQRGNVMDAAQNAGFILVLFVIVVLHELGHALTAKQFGIRTRDITLLPIGGVARLERMPEKPWQELLVALAGPAVNVALAAILMGLLLPMMAFAELWQFDPSLLGGHFLVRLFQINLFLAAFNMLPAFPMDGGRVLRALLAMKMAYPRATRLAATIGQMMATLFGFVGILYGLPFLVIIAIFVWIGAGQEASYVQTKWALSGAPIERMMITDFRTLKSDDPISVAVQHILAGFQHDFPVEDDGKVVGVLTRSDLLKALAKQGVAQHVGEVMQTQFETAQPHEMAERAFERLQRCQCHSLPVVSDGRLVGIVTMENVGEFLAIQEALRAQRGATRTHLG